ncbi:hypothetical protein F4777DRAFT_554650 [Nemania sp. FL0916]|nr:hypothetical protein F4777DRAFT_554650 [Nemania sp. FL0916]
MDMTNSVYLGIWTNYSKGRILGATLTTTQHQGALLIAFTGFLIPFVASRFWRLLCIILHRVHSTSKPRNAIHHQRQVILRNSSSPDSGLISLIQVLWAWRQSGSRKDLYVGVFPHAIYAVTCILIFSAAGGLSSQISVSAGNEVLLRGNNCGIPKPRSSTDASSFSYLSDRLNDASNYAQQCYSANASGVLGCSGYAAKNIPTAAMSYNASCPFHKDLCRGNNTSVRLDTGYIDSNSHLGLNLPLGQSFAYRSVLTCSPLVTDGHTIKSNAENASLIQYNYGSYVNADGTTLNFTYEYEDLNIQYYQNNFGAGKLAASSFLASSVTSLVYQGAALSLPGYFIPSPDISRQDGDVNLVFLSGNGVYFFGQPLDDEWYRATTPVKDIYGSFDLNQTVKVYRPTEAASPLGCVQQYQWCNTEYPKNSGCGPLASRYDAAYGATPFFNLSNEDLDAVRLSSDYATGARLIWPYMLTNSLDISISGIVIGLGAKSLASQNLLQSGVQFQLPRNQWQVDVTKWWNISLASLQSGFVETASARAPSKLPPLNDQEQELCHSQKIRSNGFSSFNLFALLFTYITSSLIILVSFIVEPILACLSYRRNHKQYEFLEWQANEALQLHRLAQEEIGQESWSGGADTVPIISPDNMLARLDISNPQHPVFSRSFPNTSVTEESKPNDSQGGSSEQPNTLIEDGDNNEVLSVILSNRITDQTPYDGDYHDNSNHYDATQGTPSQDGSHDVLCQHVNTEDIAVNNGSHDGEFHQDSANHAMIDQLGALTMAYDTARDRIINTRHELDDEDDDDDDHEIHNSSTETPKSPPSNR